MSDSADIASRTQRFNDAARTFTPPSPTRHAKLMPLKEGIVELRQKGASLRLIRELLLTVNVAVSADTIARFLVEVSDASAPRREPQRRSSRRTVTAAATQARTSAVPSPADASPQSPPPATASPNDTAPERPRTRGPRIADPRNL
jgi:hypothetical protein